MQREITKQLIADLESKIVLLSGPRQVGKTTLAKNLTKNFSYLNYDSEKDRQFIKKLEWDRTSDLVIFDELHKMRDWKRFVKGIYDSEGVRPRILVTGSARMDLMKKMGDSLAGRHHAFTLHPFTLKELKENKPNDKNFKHLLNLGGFPEPFLSGNEITAARWRISHLDIILRQDLLDLEQVRSIRNLELLLELLKTRVGSPISQQSLAEDLQVDQKTIKRWLEILESLYIIFPVSPYSKNITRGISKMKKYYFYDNGQVEGDNGAKLENLVACGLLREIDFSKDMYGRKLQLHYLRNREGNEIDFLVTERDTVILLAEVKWSDDQVSKAFKIFSYVACAAKVQIVAKIRASRDSPLGVRITSAEEFLQNLHL